MQTQHGGIKLKVKIGAFPGGQIREYQFDPGTTIETALEEAKLDGNEGEIKVNGKPISSKSAQVLDGDQILVMARVRGNE